MYFQIGDYDVILLDIDGSGGTIQTNFKDQCHYCGQDYCYGDCDGSQGDIDNIEDEDATNSRKMYNVAMDALESMILAHAIAGVDVMSEEYKEGIKASIDACANNL